MPQEMCSAVETQWAKHTRFAVGIVCATLLPGACAPASSGSPPDVRQATNVRVGSSQGGTLGFVELETEMSIIDSIIPVAPRAAWSVMADVFETLSIEASTANQRAMAMGNERFVARRIDDRPLSDFIDCGTYFGRPRADQYEVTMQVLVQLTPTSGGTRVRTALDAYARPREVAGNAFHCTSKGTLERRVSSLIVERSGA
jgi:hypothetical protein